MICLRKVPVAVMMNTWNSNISEQYGCCIIPKKETINHLFLKGEVAEEVWQYYCGTIGLVDQRTNLKHSVRIWTKAEGNSRVKLYIRWYLFLSCGFYGK